MHNQQMLPLLQLYFYLQSKFFKTDEIRVPSTTLQLKRPLPPASFVATDGTAPEENFRKSGRPSVSGTGLQTKLVPLDRGISGQSIQPSNSKVNLPAGNHSKLSYSQTDGQSKPASLSSSTALKLTSTVTQASVNSTKTPVIVSSGSLRPAAITTKVVTVSNDAICDTSFLACLEKCAEKEKVLNFFLHLFAITYTLSEIYFCILCLFRHLKFARSSNFHCSHALYPRTDDF